MHMTLANLKNMTVAITLEHVTDIHVCRLSESLWKLSVAGSPKHVAYMQLYMTCQPIAKIQAEQHRGCPVKPEHHRGLPLQVHGIHQIPYPGLSLELF